MTGLARVRVNGFDFDSEKPIQGTVIDQGKEETKTAFIHSAIHTILAINVSLLGFWLMGWWVDGGFTMGIFMMHKFAPTLMRMIMTGQV